MLGYGVRASLAVVLLGSAARGDMIRQRLIEVYSPAESGIDTAAWCAVRSGPGELDFGSDDLAAFDGSKWSHTAAGSGHTLRGLALAGPNRLYAAAHGDFGWFDRAACGWEFHSLLGCLPAERRNVGELWQVVAQPAGAVFAGSHTLYWWNGNAVRAEPFGGSRRLSLLATASDPFLQDSEGVLWRLGENRRERILNSDALRGAAVIWIDAPPGGGVRKIATSRGFVRVQAEKAEPIFSDASAAVRALGLAAVAPTGDGGLALATLRGGVVILHPDGRVRDVVDAARGLPEDEVFGLTTDAEGGLWAMGSASIARVCLKPIEWFHDFEAVGEKPSIALFHGAKGWADVTGDGAIWRESRTFDFVRDRTLNRHVWSAAAVGEDIFLARVGGIDRVTPGGLEFFLRRGGVLTALGPTADGAALWVGTGDSVLRASLDGKPAELAVSHLPDTVTSVAEEGGVLWIGTASQGIFEATIANGRWDKAESNLRPSNGASWVVRSPGDAVFAFNSAGGWCRPRGASRFLPIADFPARPVAAFAAASDGEVWLVHADRDGLGPCLARVQLHGEASSRIASWQPWLVEGMKRVGVPWCLGVESQGTVRRLGIGGSSGFLRTQIDLARGPDSVPAPRFSLTQSRDQSVEIRADVNGFGLRPALAVETWVEGVDRGWTRMDSRSRRLAALSSGRYLVRARVLAASGETGAERAAAFIVSPPWWRRPWMLPIWIAAILAAGLQWTRIRSSALRARAGVLESKVRARTAELEQVTAEKAQLVAGIGHDLRNPLNGIVGIALALEETQLAPKQRELLQAMRASARHLNGMIEDVIDYARLESHRATIQLETCAPAEILSDAIALVRPEAELAGAAIAAEIAADLPAELMLDPLRVRQILVNFLTNAVKFAGGRIRAGAAASADGRRLEFSVIDQGPGIAADDRERIGLPFARFSREVPGAGLGLATSKRWAELMGGQITIVTEIGQGCCIRLGLPCVPPEPALSAAEAPARVLLVEDEEYSAWASRAVMEKIGAGFCDRARSGAEALQRFGAAKFDLVLVDQGLPDMAGTDLGESLRRLPHGPQTRVIAISGSAPAPNWQQSGIDAFISKPLTPDKLRQALHVANRLRLLRFLTDGTPGDYRRKAEDYLALMRELVAEVEAGQASGEPERARLAAHKLQGHFRMLDAERGVAACARLAAVLDSADCLDEIRRCASEVAQWLG